MDCDAVADGDGDGDDAVATIDPRLLVFVPPVNSSTFESHEDFEHEQDHGNTGLTWETTGEMNVANMHS